MPDVFFNPEGSLPETVTLEITRPPIYLHTGESQLVRHLAAGVDRLVRKAREALAQQGRRFVGAKAVRQQPVDTIPSTTVPRRTPNPRIASPHTAEGGHAVRRLVTGRSISTPIRG